MLNPLVIWLTKQSEQQPWELLCSWWLFHFSSCEELLKGASFTTASVEFSSIIALFVLDFILPISVNDHCFLYDCSFWIIMHCSFVCVIVTAIVIIIVSVVIVMIVKIINLKSEHRCVLYYIHTYIYTYLIIPIHTVVTELRCQELGS